jgi:thiamine pyrophosphokinase
MDEAVMTACFSVRHPDASMPDTVVVFAGGAEPGARPGLTTGAAVVAADGGADYALALGVHVDVAVGDFDSITPSGLEALERAGSRIERHPVEKDATDLELALDAALALGPRRVLVVGSAGGRLDHLLGSLLLLGADAYAGVELDALLGPASVHVVRRERVLAGTPGETISLFALHGPATGVVTEGLVYPLRGETLGAGTSRGVSNVFAASGGRIALETGVILAVRP